MKVMKEIKAYKLSDGRLIEKKKEAIKLQNEIDFKNAVYKFADREVDTESVDQLFEIITENVDELRKILSVID